MKVIELLNKIANGEDVPEKFRFAEQIFEKQGSYIEDEDGDSIFDSMCTDFSNINEEIEIIGEDKKIEKIEYSIDKDGYLSVNDFREHLLQIINKINEIIDKMNTENMFNKEMALKIHEIIDKTNKE